MRASPPRSGTCTSRPPRKRARSVCSSVISRRTSLARGEIGERTREAAVRQTKSGGSTELLAVAHGNRTRNRPVSLTPRRRTPIADSRGFEAVSDAQRSRRYLTLFPGIRPGRGRDTGEKPTPNWRGASRSGDLDPWDCSNHVREGGPFDALLRGPTRAVSAAAP